MNLINSFITGIVTLVGVRWTIIEQRKLSNIERKNHEIDKKEESRLNHLPYFSQTIQKNNDSNVYSPF